MLTQSLLEYGKQSAGGIPVTRASKSTGVSRCQSARTKRSGHIRILSRSLRLYLQSPISCAACWAILTDFGSKIVCGVPSTGLSHVQDRIMGKPVNNLGLREACIQGYDFFMASTSIKILSTGRIINLISLLYVYLRLREDAPVLLLPKSTLWCGATKFPHDLSQNQHLSACGVTANMALVLKLTKITGKRAVSLHGMPALHALPPLPAADPLVITLFNSFQLRDDNHSVLQSINEQIEAPLTLSSTREDQNKMGEVIVERNHIWSSR